MSNPPPTPPARVIAYVDGFNLYYGLHESNLKHLYWLNIHALIQTMLKPGQRLSHVNYFTSRISGARPGDLSAGALTLNAKRKRQSDFLEALATLPDVRFHFGQFLPGIVTCIACGRSWTANQEKMTDVNIATQLLVDAFTDAFDIAMLVSGDSDLTPPLRTIRSHFPAKRVIVAFPPKRFSVDLTKAAHGYWHINEPALAKSQFPDRVPKADGHILTRPASWRKLP
jgi:uncharacterized LabA/DUF88 family protein